MDGFLQKRGVRLTLLLLVCAVAIWGAYRLSSIFAPLLFSFLVAYMLDPVADALERRKFTRLASVIVIFAIGALVSLTFLGVAGLYASRGVVDLFESMRGEPVYASQEAAKQDPDVDPDLVFAHPVHAEMVYFDRNEDGRWQQGYFDQARDAVTKLAEGVPEGSTEFQVYDAARSWLEETRQELRSEEKQEELREQIKSRLDWVLGAPLRAIFSSDEDASPVVQASVEVAEEAPGLFSSLFSWFSWLLLCPLYIFYFLLEIDPLIERARGYLPGRFRSTIERIIGKIDRTMASFFRGRLTICVVKGLGTSLGLMLFGVPFAFPLGLAAGFLALIPYIGIWFAVVPSVILAWLETQSVGYVLGVAGVFVAMEGIEGFWMVPKFLGKEVGLHPITVIVTMLIFGELLGFIGVLLSVPLAAIAKILAEEFILPLVEEFAAEKPPPSAESPG